VPAGEAWRRGYVIFVTFLAETVGALLLVGVVWGTREEGGRGRREGRRKKGKGEEKEE